MSGQHTQGRLVAEQSEMTGRLISETDQRPIATVWSGAFEGLGQANARRLAACWNACDGASTELLEKIVDSWIKPMADLESERDQLRAEVREWLCAECNTVYPGPPQAGFACVQCPKCGGATGPRVSMELRQARADSRAIEANYEAARGLLAEILKADDEAMVGLKAFGMPIELCAMTERIRAFLKGGA
jgi:hypothetical protein